MGKFCQIPTELYGPRLMSKIAFCSISFEQMGGF